ncbi:hypothetical protein DFH08DRAFT_1071198 [Mycena albidolilacea]|uniref:Uncharacterized protein n=1 Tax=Mycena albidolilacea TaxID=1033008 RepID=A0AAD7AVD4_9AGAR|nr:hypothetical protein DFH08DRAFT_1071198 [Mycena albidolilacea]
MEEDIDTEALQAQIDLSLSYAQNLVSSWVKPSAKPTKNSSRALEAELKEYMRRPPRLGVGAAIPETVASSSRDTERLKAHLSGKGGKRARGDDGNDPGSKQLSDAEEDSRGASTKKKARIDPFEASSKRKKAKEALKPPAPRVTPPPPEKKTAEKETPAEDVAKREDATSEQVSPPKRKKKKHKNKNPTTDSEIESLPGPSKPPPRSPPQDVKGHINGSSSSPKTGEAASPSPAPQVVDTSLLTGDSALSSPVSQTRDAQNSPLLKGPILNLNGPPPSISDVESGGEDGEPGTSKKKRRRRKKKKSLLGVKPE